MVLSSLNGCPSTLLGTSRLPLHAEQEAWRSQDALERALDARIEVFFCASGLVEPKQRLHVFFGGRTTIRARGERRQDLPGTGFFGRRVLWGADKDLPPGRRVA